MRSDRRAARPIRRRTFRRIIVVLAGVSVLSGGLPSVLNGARAAARTIIVAPNGSPKGAGTVGKPLSLGVALGSTSPAKPGDQILLRGGLYTGTYTSVVSGSSSSPIVVQSYRNEWAVFDNKTSPTPPLTIKGSDTWFRDFEVTKSDTKRISSESGPAPRDISRGSDGAWSAGDGILVAGPRTKLINLVVHDAGNGIVSLKAATDAEIYGCIIYNNGFLSTDRAWGHAVYLHNQTGTKRITDSLMFNNWAVGFHAYDNGSITDVVVEGVTSFGNGTPVDFPRANILFGPGSGTLDRIAARDSVGYHGEAKGDNVRLGFPHDSILRQNGSVTFEGNHVLGGFSGLVLQGWKSATVQGNTFSVAGTDATALAKVITNTTDGTDYQWDGNSYVDPRTPSGTYAAAFGRLTYDPDLGWSGGWLDFPGWLETTGYDGSSSYVHEAPSPPRVIVRPNRYESGRAFVTVVNQGRASVVDVDLSATGLQAGQSFEIRDVQNLSGGPIANGVYAGGSVSVPMTSTQVMQPIGGSPTPVNHTATDFGVFELRRAGS